MFTIHNIAYQGNFWHWDMELTGIDWKYFNWRQMEFYGNLSFLKTGLAFADVAQHRQPALRPGDSDVAARLRFGRHPAHRRDDLFGIINGVDYSEWNPETDPLPERPQLRRQELRRRQAGLQSGAAAARWACHKSQVSR